MFCVFIFSNIIPLFSLIFFMFYVSAFQNMIPLLSLISFGVSFSISKHIIPLLSLISFAFFWFCLKCFTAIFSCLNYLIRSLQVKLSSYFLLNLLFYRHSHLSFADKAKISLSYYGSKPPATSFC